MNTALPGGDKQEAGWLAPGWALELLARHNAQIMRQMQVRGGGRAEHQPHQSSRPPTSSPRPGRCIPLPSR